MFTESKEKKEDIGKMKKRLLLGCLSCVLLVSFDHYFAEEPVNSTASTEVTTSTQEVVSESATSGKTKEATSGTTTESSIQQSTEESKTQKLISETDVKKEEIYQFVSLKKDNPVIYENLSNQSVKANTFIVGQTFLAKEKIEQADNTIFYLLFNNLEEPIGFISAEDIEFAASQGGVYQSFWQYASVTNSDGQVYSDFEGKVKGNLTQYSDVTLRARGKYHSFEGTIYYSLYDNKDTWLGYASEKDVKITAEAQGNYQAFNQYVIVKNNNNSIRQNFKWQKK